MTEKILPGKQSGAALSFAMPTRPFRSRVRPWFILVTVAITTAIVVAPVPDGLTREGMNAIAIFVLCVIFWVSNAIPLMITSLLAIILLPLLGVLDAKLAYSFFGNQAVFFILGAFMLASAMMQSGLSTRIALLVLRWFDKKQSTLLLGVFLLPAALSYVMSEHAVAAMMLPIVLEIAAALGLQPGSRYGKTLFLAVAWGAIIGGIGTFLGGARAVLTVGILEELTGQTISFVEWLLAALPVVLAMLLVGAVVLLWLSRHERHEIAKATAYLDAKVAGLGKLSRREIGIGVLLAGAVALWATIGNAVGLATIALGAVVVAFVFKLLSWKQVERDVNWGIILMYGGAIALGSALDQSGAAGWIAETLIGNTIASVGVLFAVLVILSILLTEGISNSAVVALLMPAGIALAGQFGMDVRVAALAIGIPCGLAFMLPISTPATALAVSSKFVRTSDTMRTGIFLNLAAIVIFLVVGFFYWPMIGFSL
jgi:sodium-dependent dicarboxylate transporter 2/3/5